MVAAGTGTGLGAGAAAEEGLAASGAGARVTQDVTGGADEGVAQTANAGAKSAIAGRNLARQLASEQQIGEAGNRLAGAGTSVKLRDAERLAAQYGGSPEDWAKMGSSSYRGADGLQTETHWYESMTQDGRFEMKTKLQWLP